jgi:predicted Zn-dependent protease
MRLAVFALALSALAAAPPQADVDAALARAKAAWGVDIAVEMRSENLGPCHPGEITAHEQKEVTRTTVTFPDGSAPPAISDAAIREVIILNSGCDWNKAPLAETVAHEYGHALGVAHSKDEHSVMFWTPLPGQKVTRENRAAAAK